jgi:hypothetical protein
MSLGTRVITSGLAGLCAYLAVALTIFVAGPPRSTAHAFVLAGLFVVVYVPTVERIQRARAGAPRASTDGRIASPSSLR